MKSRAAILHDVGGPWSVEEFELDPPHAGEVFVEMAAAGLCHSDDHILKGDMSAPNEVMRSMGLPTMFPTIGGHEGSGIVLEVGDDSLNVFNLLQIVNTAKVQAGELS